MKNQFDIKVLRQHWIKDDGKDNPEDLCSHGEVYLRIGDKEISNKESGSWTISSTALYLMRTLNENYEPNKYASQLIPCCGHFFMADENDDDFVIIMGCPNGIDWSIKHIENGQVKHILQNGEEGIIGKAEYRKIVIEFVNQVEKFYEQSNPKVIPEDEFDRKGYEAFWKEWKKLKREIEN